MPTRRVGGEGRVVKKNMPIVVIPKRRKHKNYVSRKRNPQIANNLRRCTSDPNIYKSYNQWALLCLKDNENILKKNVVKNQTSKRFKELMGTSGKSTGTQNVLDVLTSPSSQRKKLFNDKFDKSNVHKKQTFDNNLNNNTSKLIKTKPQAPIQLAKEKLTAKKFSLNNPSLGQQINFKSNQASVDYAESTEINVLTKPAGDIKPPLAEFEPLNDLIVEEDFSIKKITPDPIVLANKRQRFDELAKIKQELRETGAKLPSLSVINKKMVTKKKVLHQQQLDSKKEASDETKAKNTVDAVTAAFSSKLSTVTNNEALNNVGSFNINITTRSKNNLTTYQKPPISPSMGATRRKFTTDQHFDSSKISSTKLKNVLPTLAVTKTTGIFENDDMIRKPKEIQAECSSTITLDSIRSRIYDDEKSCSENTTVSAAIPVLNLSKKKFLQINSDQIQKPVTPKASTIKLLASLQLPPSVSAKVDRIIATGGSRKNLVVSIISL